MPEDTGGQSYPDMIREELDAIRPAPGIDEKGLKVDQSTIYEGAKFAPTPLEDGYDHTKMTTEGEATVRTMKGVTDAITEARTHDTPLSSLGEELRPGESYTPLPEAVSAIPHREDPDHPQQRQAAFRQRLKEVGTPRAQQMLQRMDEGRMLSETMVASVETLKKDAGNMEGVGAISSPHAHIEAPDESPVENAETPTTQAGVLGKLKAFFTRSPKKQRV